ncbi:uncharacterized protein T551_03388 [Pneumocystis jirovecii RU7]|uniref:Uncharacterized protein n=1 Tax=Pneumocystis jirovecii (strain RU7) TaxID=1408657 RepID=A0A0W4ZEZ1_PNEJ7|nr:uncharacterized protein T551_03604 [Pneumocystis jirovecii RU7]XP_018228257.1 uncharacterized protein T551_03388 [Pneumocystis jirovecii RU7]KTW26306.1 hypothetical protein T551_03604 [Pneumocystis jirovecii RU7]KTW26926.1 hypothetical protein T551_03388 [Pneumocystis jirovecii RU7]
MLSKGVCEASLPSAQAHLLGTALRQEAVSAKTRERCLNSQDSSEHRRSTATPTAGCVTIATICHGNRAGTLRAKRAFSRQQGAVHAVSGTTGWQCTRAKLEIEGLSVETDMLPQQR